jgi:Sfi1 spindle body protein
LVDLCDQAVKSRRVVVIKSAFRSWNNRVQMFRDRAVIAMHFDNFHNLKVVFKFWKSSHEELVKRVLWAGLISERRIKIDVYGYWKERFKSVNKAVKIDDVDLRMQCSMFSFWKSRIDQIKEAREFRRLSLLRTPFGYWQLLTKSVNSARTIAVKYRAWSLQRNTLSILIAKMDILNEREILAQSVSTGSLYIRAYGWWAFKTNRIGENLDRGSQALLKYQIQSTFRSWIILYENYQSKKRLAEESAKNSILTRAFNRWKASVISKLELKLRMTTLYQRLESHSTLKKKKIYTGN